MPVNSIYSIMIMREMRENFYVHSSDRLGGGVGLLQRFNFQRRHHDYYERNNVCTCNEGYVAKQLRVSMLCCYVTLPTIRDYHVIITDTSVI